jgi:predicted alpha/beta-hydrolase family hydrolase
VDPIEIATPRGPARAHVARPSGARGALIMGHGAGGGITAPDLQATAGVAADHRLAVALVEQPYRVAGRRSPAPAPHLDAAFTAVVGRLAVTEFDRLPLILGGRSSGARVACRCADALGAVAVVCLAFPLLPPRRANSRREPESRLPELDAVSAPTLVVQGSRDPFGLPPAGPRRQVITLNGDHSLRSDLPGLRVAIGDWLSGLAKVRCDGG